MRDLADQFRRQFETDDIQQLRCSREVCALAFKVLSDRVRRYGLPKRQEAMFLTTIDDLAGLVRDRG